MGAVRSGQGLVAVRVADVPEVVVGEGRGGGGADDTNIGAGSSGGAVAAWSGTGTLQGIPSSIPCKRDELGVVAGGLLRGQSPLQGVRLVFAHGGRIG